MEKLTEGIGAFNDDLFWPVVIAVLVIASLYFSIRLGLVQFRLIPDMFRALRGSTDASHDGDKKQSISSFQAFAVSAAARVGTGNVAGVATAISVGGPGAVMWMWLMALLVGAASFVESTLAQLYKVPYRTGFRGGPAYYMQHGLGQRWMGILFAITITVTFGFVFNAVQSNTISTTLAGSAEELGAGGLSWLPAAIGIGLVVLTGAVIIGGIKRIANVAQALVPLMALLYLLLGIAVVALNADKVPGVLALIFSHAFGFREIASAALGTAIIQGVRRGMFSNEGGLGSAPNAGATASVSHPVKQGLVQTLGVYFDTLIVCSVTAFIILVSNPTYGEDLGATMTQDALGASLGTWAVHMLTVIIFLLAFTSVLGNYYYGESNIGFLNSSDALLNTYKCVFLVATFLGSIGSIQLVWTLADTTMGFMALVNLAAIIPLGGVAYKLLKDYTDQRKQGLDPVFTVDRVPELRNVQCWGPQAAPRDTADV